MRMKPVVFVCALGLLCGCGSISVKTASERGFHLSNYSSFGFKKPSREFESAQFSPASQQQLRAAVAEALGERGLRMAPKPDLWAGYFLRVRAKEFSLEEPTAEGDSMTDVMNSYYGFVYGSGKSLNQQKTIKYHEGTLVVDLVDARSNRIVWQGVAKGAMHRNDSEERMGLRIREAVQKMFHRLPP